MAVDKAHLLADAGLAISTMVAVWAVGRAAMWLSLRAMFHGFGEQHRASLPMRDAAAALASIAVTAAAPLVMWWGWRHGYWLMCAAQLALPPGMVVRLRHRYDWHSSRCLAGGGGRPRPPGIEHPHDL
ncbi:hypothetical protein ACWFRM_41625 [Streptomyces sp. NPDC055144]